VRRAAAHVFVADLDRPEIGDDDRHHLERVLRLRVGEKVTASDGRGGLRVCAFAPGGALEPDGEIEVSAPPSPAIGVGFALVKAEKPEWFVQKLTECGVDRIVPVASARSIVRWDPAKATRSLERWRRVAVEAAMQSRRRWLPAVEPLRPFEGVVGGTGFALADPDGDPPDVERFPMVLVGPEGGWSDEERAAAAGRFVRFGPTVLRTATAAVAAGVVLVALRDGAVRSAHNRAPRS